MQPLNYSFSPISTQPRMDTKEYLKKIPFLKSIISYIRIILFPAHKPPTPGRTELLSRIKSISIDSVPSIIEFLGATRMDPYFVKVGANDGLTGDPCGDIFLRDRRWKGLLIEPVNYCAAKLMEIYADQSRFTIEQSAIGQKIARRPFFFMAQEAKEHIQELPDWYDQLGSFSRTHIEKHFDIDVSRFIIEKQVNVFPLSVILERRGCISPVLLHIDVEGFDYEVLKSLNFRKSHPDMILIEHKHLSASSLFSLIELLQSNRYLLFNTGSDLAALSGSACSILDSTPQLSAMLA